MYRFLCEHVFSFLHSNSLGVGLLGHKVDVECCKRQPKCFAERLDHFVFYQQSNPASSWYCELLFYSVVQALTSQTEKEMPLHHKSLAFSHPTSPPLSQTSTPVMPLVASALLLNSFQQHSVQRPTNPSPTQGVQPSQHTGNWGVSGTRNSKAESILGKPLCFHLNPISLFVMPHRTPVQLQQTTLELFFLYLFHWTEMCKFPKDASNLSDRSLTSSWC